MGLKRQKLEFVGNVENHAILIGSHGNTTVKVDGNFDLSGVVYCPKYIITISLYGSGKISLRGVCKKVIVKRIVGECTLDLSQLSTREIRFNLLKDKAQAVTGRVRTIDYAELKDEAAIVLKEKPLLVNGERPGNATVIENINSRDIATV